MNKPETDFYHEFRIAIHKQLSKDYHLTRIESNLTVQGIPDINFCYKKAECWIELKVGDNDLSSLQHSWIHQHRQAGGLVFTVWKLREDIDYIVDSGPAITKAYNINEVVKIIVKEMMYHATFPEPFRL